MSWVVVNDKNQNNKNTFKELEQKRKHGGGGVRGQLVCKGRRMQKEAAQDPVCNQGVGKVVPSKPNLLLQELNLEALDYALS